MKKIDAFLNKITMYKLVLYHLIVILVAAIVLAIFHILAYNPIAILFSALFITTICLLVNSIFAWGFDAPTNTESAYITGLILACIITPISHVGDMQFFSIAIWASVIAMTSKYLFTLRKKHLFNPVAISVAITALVLNQSASWWVGTSSLFIFIVLGGILIVRKMQRSDLFFSFLITAIIVSFIGHAFGLADIWRLLANTSLLFFAFIMLTEPLTTPPTRGLRICYGILIGLLFYPEAHIGSIYFTPELAIVA